MKREMERPQRNYVSPPVPQEYYGTPREQAITDLHATLRKVRGARQRLHFNDKEEEGIPNDPLNLFFDRPLS